MLFQQINKKARRDSDSGPAGWIPIFFFWVRLMKTKLLLNPVRRPRLFMSTVIQPPVVPGASPSAPLTSDSGSNQKPHGLRLNAHPLDHVGDEISMEMCVYIALNTLNHQRTWNLKNQKFDPARVRTQVTRVITRIPNALTTRPLGRWKWKRNLKI